MSKARLTLVACLAISAASALGWLAYDRTAHGYTDWVFFEVGARVLDHYRHQSLYADPRFHLYVDNADLQIGPPALWLVAGFEWLPFRAVYVLFSYVLVGLGLVAVGFATATGQRAAHQVFDRTRQLALGAAVVVAAGIWAYQIEAWKHLDDDLALTLAAVAAYLIVVRRAWWLAAALLGTAIATKPWAIVIAPMLLGVESKHRFRAVLVTIVVAVAWWAPFLIAAPSTAKTLGHFPVLVEPGSVLHLVGLHGDVASWLRLTQFALGLVVGMWVGVRSHWMAGPLAALTARVMTDPYAYGYYGLGPLMFALMLDAAGKGYRRLPAYTATTAILEFALPACGLHGNWLGLSKLVWSVSVLACLLRPSKGQTASVAGQAAPDVRLSLRARSV